MAAPSGDALDGTDGRVDSSESAHKGGAQVAVQAGKLERAAAQQSPAAQGETPARQHVEDQDAAGEATGAEGDRDGRLYEREYNPREKAGRRGSGGLTN
jgi:hypothetical protein